MSTTFIENGKKITDETRLLQLEEQLNIIVTLFENGELGEALAKVFITMENGTPMSNWSIGNVLGLIFMGATDARGFRQWEKVNREVKPDSRKNPRYSILVPIMKSFYPLQYLTDKSGNKIPVTGRNGKQIRGKNGLLWKVRQYLSGWKVVAVWDISETTGEPLEMEDDDSADYLDSLPLIEVARSLGVDVMPYSGEGSGAYGWYSASTNLIGMGVKDIQTWLHELVHLADDRLGNLVEQGNKPTSEAVAETGAVLMLAMLGNQEEMDLNFGYNYIKRYAETINKRPEALVKQVAGRTIAAVKFLIDTAEDIAAEQDQLDIESSYYQAM